MEECGFGFGPKSEIVSPWPRSDARRRYVHIYVRQNNQSAALDLDLRTLQLPEKRVVSEECLYFLVKAKSLKTNAENYSFHLIFIRLGIFRWGEKL
jgi:hypothetical protein